MKNVVSLVVILLLTAISVSAQDVKHDSVARPKFYSHSEPVWIYFNSSRSEVTQQYMYVINYIVDELNKNKDKTIQIFGYAYGSICQNVNQTLSEKRAKAVMDAVISKGIGKDRITATGCGSINKVARNNTKYGRHVNRRVEYRFINKKVSNQ